MPTTQAAARSFTLIQFRSQQLTVDHSTALAFVSTTISPHSSLLLRFTRTMTHQVLGNGHGGRASSPSVVARMRASRAAEPMKKGSSPPATAQGVKARPTMAAPPTTPTVKRLVKVSSDEEMATRRHSLDKQAAANKKHKDKEEEEMRQLRGEVEALREEVERLLRLNTELERHKSGLAHQLTLAHRTITQLQQQQQQHDIQAKTIVSDLSQQHNQKEAAGRGNIASTKPQPPKPPSPPPPPNRVPGGGGGGVPVPPPPPQQGPSRVSMVNKATALVDTYNSLTKRDTKRTAAAHHDSIVGELQNRSTHLLSIKADVETKGEFINGLIKKVHTTTYTDVEQVLTFVDWLDQQLSTLSDETAVLKHFSWPERKADALRESAFEYRDLNHVLTEISSLNDDGSPTSCEATLRKTSSLLDKLEKSMNRLVNLRSSAMPSYKEFRIPTDWMLDSGIASKLAKVCMKRALKELDRDTGNEAALVAQSVRFTYRVHQFAGGLDCEAMRAFEELRQRVRSASSPRISERAKS